MDRKMIPRLKLIKLKHHLTQKKLAQLAGIPLWKITKWESGIRIPTLREAAMVQRALDKIENPELCVLNPLEFAFLLIEAKVSLFSIFPFNELQLKLFY